MGMGMFPGNVYFCGNREKGRSYLREGLLEEDTNSWWTGASSELSSNNTERNL
jgi:hypothetical protein